MLKEHCAESLALWIWVAELSMKHFLERVVAIKAISFMSFACIYNSTSCMEPHVPSSIVLLLYLCAFVAVPPMLLCCRFK